MGRNPPVWNWVKKSPSVNGMSVQWRLPESVMAQMDRVIEARRKANPRTGRHYSRSALLREFVEPWVDGFWSQADGVECWEGMLKLREDEPSKYFSLWIPRAMVTKLGNIAEQLQHKPEEIVAGVLAYALLRICDENS